MTHSEYKEKSREHQIRFREEVLRIPLWRSPKRTLRWTDKNGVSQEKVIRVKSSLYYCDAKDDSGYVIFYPGFRKEITDAVNKSSLATKGQMVTNLLRSEHIPYNIFYPMLYDLDGTKVLFNRLLSNNRIYSIERIVIEYNPGGLKDGTAFDVYVEYRTSENKLGGIGIEVKYTEKEYPIKKNTKEWNETHDNGQIHLADNYRVPSFESGWFNEVCISDAPISTKKHVVANKFRQIWRNHLLGASMILNNQLSEFTSLTVYPEGNVHFQEVLPDYEENILTDKGRDTFQYKSYEELFSLMEESFNPTLIPNLNDWISYLRQRYIVK